MSANPRLIVAGSSSSVPRPDRACSSYLIEDGDSSVVFDLGSGSLANLRRYVDYDRVGAIVISHMHADHFLDLIPLRYALRYGSRQRQAKLPIYLPPGGLATLKQLVSAFADEGGEFLSDVFALSEYDPSRPLALDGATLHFAPTAHFVPAFAIRWQRDGSSLTYSADTAPDATVSALARGCDLFLCEATLRLDEREIGPRGHSSGLEAAEMAHDAGARRLVLTHYGEASTAADLDDAARTRYAGPITVADDHAIFNL